MWAREGLGNGERIYRWHSPSCFFLKKHHAFHSRRELRPINDKAKTFVLTGTCVLPFFHVDTCSYLCSILQKTARPLIKAEHLPFRSSAIGKDFTRVLIANTSAHKWWLTVAALWWRMCFLVDDFATPAVNSTHMLHRIVILSGHELNVLSWHVALGVSWFDLFFGFGTTGVLAIPPLDALKSHTTPVVSPRIWM